MKLTLLSFVLILLSSCSYQYFTVSGDQVSRNEKNDFVIENDTLRLTYRFSGDQGPVTITIYNKTNEPLEINWKKSALIMNKQAYGYYSPNLFLNGNVRQDTTHSVFSNRSDFTNLTAKVYVNEPTQFIPPKSSISKVPLSLPVHAVFVPQSKKITYKTKDNFNIKFRRAEYTPEKSPVAFRSYLSFNYGGNELKGFSLDHYFYVSEIWQSASEPDLFLRDIIDKGNVFYVRR